MTDTTVEAGHPARRLLRPGETCWRIECADRVGWDFDTRIKLDPLDGKSDVPNRLGQFLKWVVARNPELNIYMLRWGLGAMYALGRGTTPLFILNWMTDAPMPRATSRMRWRNVCGSRTGRRSSSSIRSPRKDGSKKRSWARRARACCG